MVGPKVVGGRPAQPSDFTRYRPIILLGLKCKMQRLVFFQGRNPRTGNKLQIEQTRAPVLAYDLQAPSLK